MTELISMFYAIFYILLLKEILKGKVCYLTHLASNPDVSTFWKCMVFTCIFILLFDVLIWILSIFFLSFQQSHPAFHCPRSQGLASSLGFAVEPSSNVHWIGHQRSTLWWVESQLQFCILLCLKPHLHCWPTCVFSYETHKIGLSHLCVGKLYFSPFFPLLDKSNLHCHFLCPKSAVASALLNPTEWLQFFSQVLASFPPG